MLTSVPNIIPGFMKGPSRPSRGNQHLMLAGIHQTIFLNQWGEPETRIDLKKLGSFDKLGSIFLIEDSAAEVHYSVWIYRKRDRILFFTKKRLVSHSRWSAFRERGREKPREPGGRSLMKSSPFLTTTLSLVA
jgi:hypothetical protein